MGRAAERGLVGEGGAHARLTQAPPRVEYRWCGRPNGRRVPGDGAQVLSHLVGLVSSKVTVTLEIHAEVPDGVPKHVVRVVTENCRTLKFSNHGFEDE